MNTDKKHPLGRIGKTDRFHIVLRLIPRYRRRKTGNLSALGFLFMFIHVHLWPNFGECMNLSDFLESFGRTVFERPLASRRAEEPPELAEIRLAILDHIREKSYRAGGRKVFPFDLLRVELRGLEAEPPTSWTAASSAITWSGKRVTRCARRLPFPENLRLEVAPPAGLPQPGVEWIVVEVAAQDQRGEGAGRGQPGGAGRHGQRRRDPARKAAHQHRPRGRRVSRRAAFSAAMTWLSPKKRRSTAPSPASTRTSCGTGRG